MNRYVSDEDLEDLQDCLTQKEKDKIDGKGFLRKIIKNLKDRKQAKNIEVYNSMINNIEKDDISNIIPDEYKK